jgi:phage tail-like protein
MMKERDFKTQVFKTAEHWGSGLLYRLEPLEQGGLTIVSVPSVTEKLRIMTGIGSPVALAADCCGIVYIRDGNTLQTHRYDPATGVSERLPCAEAAGEPRIVLDGTRLWLSDPEAGQISACSLRDFQVILSIDILESPIAIAVSGEGDLYALDRSTRLFYRFDRHGTLRGSFGSPYLKEPIGCTVGKEDVVYAIDRESKGFLLFSKDGEYRGATGDIGAMVPVLVTAGAEGSLFLLTETGEVYQFDADGSAVGKMALPEDAGPVIWLIADKCGKLYASTAEGIYLLGSGKTFTREKGFYYSKTLDSGIAGCRWHRLALQGEIPAGTTADIFFYASDDEALKDLVDQAFADSVKTAQEKAVLLDSVIAWVGPENIAGDMLLRAGTGRYLWVKLSLATYDQEEKPSVRVMKIFYPRISYLRYLPAIYQEDPVSREFLERFLSLFESVFYDIEVDISKVARYLDPDTTPPEFLRWLSSWVNMAIEEDWPEKRKRDFIRQAARLFTMKGTVEGLSRFVEIYTGKAPVILEHGRASMPVVLGGPFQLGVDAIVGRAVVRGFRLGDDSIIGHVALRDVVEAVEDHFLPMAYRFTIVTDLTRDERTRYEIGLKKLISDEKPAHTACRLRVAGGLTTGGGGYVGISTVVGGYEPLRVGSSAVGSTLLLDVGEEGGRVGTRSWVGTDTKLI